MKINKHLIFFLILAFILLLHMPAAGNEGISFMRDYHPSGIPELPEVLNVGIPMYCGNYQIQIMGQPIITKSGIGMVADLDMYYLIIRVGLTNMSEKTVGWLTPGSFIIQETYNRRIYGTYSMDPIISAKFAAGFKLPAFYTQIEPGQTLQTPLVFSVYSGAQSWVLTFDPHVFGQEEAAEPIRFQIPAALLQ